MVKVDVSTNTEMECADAAQCATVDLTPKPMLPFETLEYVLNELKRSMGDFPSATAVAAENAPKRRRLSLVIASPRPDIPAPIPVTAPEQSVELAVSSAAESHAPLELATEAPMSIDAQDVRDTGDKRELTETSSELSIITGHIEPDTARAAEGLLALQDFRCDERLQSVESPPSPGLHDVSPRAVASSAQEAVQLMGFDFDSLLLLQSSLETLKAKCSALSERTIEDQHYIASLQCGLKSSREENLTVTNL